MAPATERAGGRDVLARLLSIGLLGRAGWGVIDQAFVSLANFGLGVAVARLVSRTEFGAFGVAFTAYTVALIVARGFATQPLLIRFGACDDETLARSSARATGLALLIGLLGGSICVILGLVFPRPLSNGFFGLAVALPGLLLQDAWRFVLFTQRRGHRAIVNDLILTVVLVPSIALVAVSGTTSVFTLMLCWGAGASAAAVAGVIQTGVRPRLGEASRWWREHWDITARFLSSELIQMGGGQLVLFGVGALVGLAAVGSLRGALLLFGPTYVLSVGVNLTMVPEASRLTGTLTRLRRLTVIVSGLQALGAGTLGAILLLLPDGVGRQILGASWEGVRPVLLPIALFSTLSLLSAGPQIALRVPRKAAASCKSAPSDR